MNLKNLCFALLLYATLSIAQAQTATITLVGDPPEHGTFTGAGTYGTENIIEINIQAADGWYIEKIKHQGPPAPVVGGLVYLTAPQVLQKTLQVNDGTPGWDPTMVTKLRVLIYLTEDVTDTVTFAPISPRITTQPLDQILVAGAKATLIGGATGRLPITYQWQKDGADISGATKSNLVFTTIQSTDSGSYALIANNAFGTSTSITAVVRVENFLVSISSKPVSASTFEATGPISVTLQSKYPNGNLFYTLDGSEPDFSGERYNGPFTVSPPKTLKAIAYSADFAESVISQSLEIIQVPSFALKKTAFGGSIVVDPDNASFQSNTVVTMTALASPGWTFMGWTGALTGNNPTNQIRMDREKQIEAIFGTTLGTAATGNGTLSIFPSQGPYPYGSTVRLTAVPTTGNYFGVWGNAASGNENPLSLVITAPTQSISVLFAPLPASQVALTVLVEGGGTVSVDSPANRYAIDVTNLLTATPNPGQSFLGWSGDFIGTQNPLSLVMDKSKVITARFTATSTLSIAERNGFFELTFSAPQGTRLRIDASSNLKDWVPLFEKPSFIETLRFLDEDSRSLPHRMYRAIVP